MCYKIIFLSIFSLISCSDYRIPRDYWACGSGQFLNEASENVLHKCRDEIYFGYDLCCAIHDDCYDQLLGQNYCDSNFCTCVQNVAKRSKIFSLCTFFAKGSCNAVRILGGPAYEASGNGSTKIYILKMNRDLQIKFFEIYQFCKSQYLTLNVCAMTYDFCVFTDINNGKTCLNSFSRCLESTNSTRLPNPSCDKSIEKFQILIRKQY
ncbi:unnamed protein product [Caenorhabditis angaria]|uniref:Phospholipase A(2) n=1 Tax=Caenorhabditis angaria TaxID=860376 RepID=A0A9P1IRA2_9PELO|nr:unnamed protein product [Caenorhabditis angaria]